MKSSPNLIFSASSTVTFALHKDNSTPPPQPKKIPISADEAAVAVAIQSGYCSHRIRSLYRRITAMNAEADRVWALIQRQDTVDAICRDEREKLRMNEALIRLLLELDAVPESDPTVWQTRNVSRGIVGLQEILDGNAEARVEDYGDRWGPQGLFYWDVAMEELEERVFKKGG